MPNIEGVPQKVGLKCCGLPKPAQNSLKPELPLPSKSPCAKHSSWRVWIAVVALDEAACLQRVALLGEVADAVEGVLTRLVGAERAAAVAEAGEISRALPHPRQQRHAARVQPHLQEVRPRLHAALDVQLPVQCENELKPRIGSGARAHIVVGWGVAAMQHKSSCILSLARGYNGLDTMNI